MLRLALAGLTRILTKSDLDPLAVPRGGVVQQSLDITRIGSRAQQIEQPIAAISVAAELDADRPVGVIELGLLGGGEIPISDDVQFCRRCIGEGTSFLLEIEPGRRPDLPIAAEQPLALEQW
jgi:hypothetical protein